jgi:hypothetical protein
LAFTAGHETGRGFILLSLETGARRTLLSAYPVDGIGPWSPDGRFVLASISVWEWAATGRIIAADTAADSYLPILDLEDPSPGPSDYAWIKRSLLLP